MQNIFVRPHPTSRCSSHGVLLAGLIACVPWTAHAQLSGISVSGATNAVLTRQTIPLDQEPLEPSVVFADPQTAFTGSGEKQAMRSEVRGGSSAAVSVDLNPQQIWILASAVATHSEVTLGTPGDAIDVIGNVVFTGSSTVDVSVTFTVAAPTSIGVASENFSSVDPGITSNSLSMVDANGQTINLFPGQDLRGLRTTLAAGQYQLRTTGIGTLEGNKWSLALSASAVPETSTGLMWLTAGLLLSGALQRRKPG